MIVLGGVINVIYIDNTGENSNWLISSSCDF